MEKEMRKIELIMRNLPENIGKMSNSYFLSNISYGRGQSMNKIFNSHHFILNKNLKGMMVMVNIGKGTRRKEENVGSFQIR